MKDEFKYHDLDKSVTKRIKAELAERGITKYPVKCDSCDGHGADPMSDNMNWLPCSNCGGKGEYMVAV